jgi:hypothetical protein
LMGSSIESHARSCILAHALVDDLRSIDVNLERCLVLTESRCPGTTSTVSVWRYMAVQEKPYVWYVSSRMEFTNRKFVYGARHYHI